MVQQQQEQQPSGVSIAADSSAPLRYAHPYCPTSPVLPHLTCPILPQETLNNLRAACRETRIMCAVMLDTKGPEIRTGFLENEQPVVLEAGHELTITTDYTCVCCVCGAGCGGWQSRQRGCQAAQTLLWLTAAAAACLPRRWLAHWLLCCLLPPLRWLTTLCCLCLCACSTKGNKDLIAMSYAKLAEVS